ncbi:hypothetical protein cce_4985 [Crocosphaera subtropica ATCC 51142]|uniref:Uncharacterized protein n=1 Tax=Crocosphaera subtropica (strain ATCC 51142 / BH68) TaxID=43989 RepID=B1X2H0_CROS5|nr:hypothetical protein [Crocosphaera subtropica]ACB54331.1 hypothetical protein cce_4985 [Crocosphaera subtropica ATCC 51142]
MKEEEQIIVNRMVGKVPLIGSFSPIQFFAAIAGFLLGYLAHANTGNMIVGVGAALWVFFTIVLVLGNHHWQYLNKYRKATPWSRGRRLFKNPLESRKPKNGTKN